MTSRQLYEFLLIEQNKRKAPSILLEDFNYFANRTILQYINKRYNIFETSQQVSDDLDCIREIDFSINLTQEASTYKAVLPTNYFHILNCDVEFNINKNIGCYKEGDKLIFPATKLTSDSARAIVQNHYYKPDYRYPYFYKNFNKIEIRSGSTSTFVPIKIYIDYLKKPNVISLTRDQIDQIDSDTSENLQFPDYVCQEILNELVHIVLENTSDPRLQSHIPISQSIAQPSTTK